MLQVSCLSVWLMSPLILVVSPTPPLAEWGREPAMGQRQTHLKGQEQTS